MGAVEVICILLYLSGSYINTHSEYSRHVWKLKEQNRGRLYTKGLLMVVRRSIEIRAASAVGFQYSKKIADLFHV